MHPERRYEQIVRLVREARAHGLNQIDLAALERIIFAPHEPPRKDLGDG